GGPIPIWWTPFPWTAWTPFWRMPWTPGTPPDSSNKKAGPKSPVYLLYIFVQDPDQRIGVLLPTLAPDHFPLLIDHQGGQPFYPEGLGELFVLVHIDLDHLSLVPQGRGDIA